MNSIDKYMKLNAHTWLSKIKLLSCVRLLQRHGLEPTMLLHPWYFSKQEYLSGLPFPSPEDLPNPWIEPGSPAL